MANPIRATASTLFREPIRVQIVEQTNKIDWNIWFLLIAVLSLIAAVFVPFLQKKYEESKSKYGFHLYVKKKLGIVLNLLTYDKLPYRKLTNSDDVKELQLTFDNLVIQFEKDYNANKETVHPLFAFEILFNLQNLLFTVKRIQYSLAAVDLRELDEKTLEFGDKLSKKEHHKLNAVFMLIEHYVSITTFHDRFGLLQSIEREIKDSTWVGLKVSNTVLENQQLILDDLKHVRENESSLREIINISKLLIQELKSYFHS